MVRLQHSTANFIFAAVMIVACGLFIGLVMRGWPLLHIWFGAMIRAWT